LSDLIPDVATYREQLRSRIENELRQFDGEVQMQILDLLVDLNLQQITVTIEAINNAQVSNPPGFAPELSSRERLFGSGESFWRQELIGEFPEDAHTVCVDPGHQRTITLPAPEAGRRIHIQTPSGSSQVGPLHFSGVDWSADGVNWSANQQQFDFMNAPLPPVVTSVIEAKRSEVRTRVFVDLGQNLEPEPEPVSAWARLRSNPYA
jgi:hypothetical protein